jgi:hypothetical protein
MSPRLLVSQIPFGIDAACRLSLTRRRPIGYSPKPPSSIFTDSVGQDGILRGVGNPAGR